jgi:hypothetical protein
LKLVLVKWVDAAADDGGWVPNAEAELAPVATWTVGWVVREDDEHIVVCNTINGLDHVSGRIVIPTHMVKDIKVIGHGSVEIEE